MVNSEAVQDTLSLSLQKIVSSPDMAKLFRDVMACTETSQVLTGFTDRIIEGSLAQLELQAPELVQVAATALAPYVVATVFFCAGTTLTAQALVR
eukprot:2345052-Rhodomonas_salina.1